MALMEPLHVPELEIALEQEDDGRWIAEVVALSGVIAYGPTHDAAIAGAKALALRVLVDRIEHGEPVPPAVEQLFGAAGGGPLP